MNDPYQPLLELVLQAIARHKANDGGPGDAELQDLPEARWLRSM